MKSVFQNFLGNHRAENYRDIVTEMLTSFEQMKVSMSLKIHLLHQHIDVFPENLGKVSDEHGERVHQQMRKIEERFRGKPVENMLAEFVWYTFQEAEDEHLAEAERHFRTEESQPSLRSHFRNTQK